MGPRHVQPGDRVVTLYGGAPVFILRVSESCNDSREAESHVLIGDAYLVVADVNHSRLGNTFRHIWRRISTGSSAERTKAPTSDRISGLSGFFYTGQVSNRS